MCSEAFKIRSSYIPNNVIITLTSKYFEERKKQKTFSHPYIQKSCFNSFREETMSGV